MTCLKKITAAQKGLEGTDAFMAGEQLKEICRDVACAELVAKDLDMKGMGLPDCAAKIKAYADKHRMKGSNCVCVPPDVAERIIREFYGLPGRGQEAAPQPAPRSDFLDLEDFL